MAAPTGQGVFIVSSTSQISNPVNGNTWALTSSNPPVIWAYYNNQWNLISSAYVFLAFDFGSGQPTASQTLGFSAPQTFLLPANCVGSSTNLVTGSSASINIQIEDNNSNIGNVNINGTSVTYNTTGGLAQTISNNTLLSLVATASPDATLAGVRITLALLELS